MTPIRKGLNPVKIPFPIKVSDPILASWCHEVRNAIQRIEGRIPTVANRPKSSATASHPYKIYAAKEGAACRVHVWRGACTANLWAWDSSDVYGHTNELTPGIGGGAMVSESVPIGDAAAGYLTLTASTTYGIWLTVGAINNFPAASIYDPITGLFPDNLTVHFQTFYFGTAAIHANSTNINASDSPAMSGVTTVDTKNLAIYLGKVVVDADGNGVVTQYRKSDAEVHAPLLTAPITVSTDTSGGDNTIIGGSDGGAYLP